MEENRMRIQKEKKKLIWVRVSHKRILKARDHRAFLDHTGRSKEIALVPEY